METTEKNLGRYRILERIGAGGMGVVYRALDQRLGREVALKVLPAGRLGEDEARRRFRQEALLLSQLNHPNIATVHDLDSIDGQDVLVMEYLPGRSLDDVLGAGPLAEPQVLDLGLQLATGLAAAHERGMIHRDLKPSNLRVLPDGRLKILDFGLAKWLTPDPAAATQEALTAAQVVVGTVPYMAPEQLQGRGADERSDVYAAGAVLYEMATGRRPHGSTGVELITAILHRPPPQPRDLNPSVSEPLQRVLLKALAKSPEERYPSIRALLDDLRRLAAGEAEGVARPGPARRGVWLAGGGALLLAAAALVWAWSAQLLPPRGAAGRVKLAVLPFENLSPDPEQEYFSDGLTEEMIAHIGRLNPKRLAVIARTSAMAYKSTRKTIDRIGHELAVQYVVAGSVRRSAQRVRISAQLNRVRDQTQLWSESFERPLQDVWALQSEVAERVAQSMRVALLPQARQAPVRATAAQTAAHEAWLKGRYYWNKRSPEDLRRAVASFEEAVRADPRYAPAHGGLADAWLLIAAYHVEPAAKAAAKAKQSALAALRLDPRLAGPYAALASIRHDYEWDWAGAEKAYRRALELDPGSATARQWYADLLATEGRLDEALGQILAARELDPLSLSVNADVASCYLYRREYDKAVEQYRRTLELEKDFLPAHTGLALVHWLRGDHAAARASYEEALALSGADSAEVRSLRAAYPRERPEGLWRWRLANLEQIARESYVSPYEFASVHALLGEKDEAFGWLDRALSERAAGVTGVQVDPAFDRLRDDPRYLRTLGRLRLPAGGTGPG